MLRNKIVSICAGVALLGAACTIQPITPPAPKAAALTADTLANLAYKLEYTESGTAQLTDGRYEDKANRIIITWVDTYALGEMNGEQVAAVILLSNTGGSGSFSDLAVVVNQDGTPTNVATTFLGDRLTFNAITIEENAISVDFVTQGPSEGMCCGTERTLVSYALQNGQLVESEHEVIGVQPKVTETAVMNFVPETVPTTTEAGSCFTNAIGLGRADAWRCTVGNRIYDPCFQIDDEPTIVCDADPIRGERGFVLELTEPLPAPELGQLTQPWQIELGNGVVCGLSTGTVPGVGDQVAPYACEDQWFLMADLRTDAPVWFAQKVRFDVGEAGYTIRASVVATVAKVWQ